MELDLREKNLAENLIFRADDVVSIVFTVPALFVQVVVTEIVLSCEVITGKTQGRINFY